MAKWSKIWVRLLHKLLHFLTINLINFFYNPFIITWDGMAIQI
nr:MAG TPA: hypothetical protein [Caudoviricetes sp.]